MDDRAETEITNDNIDAAKSIHVASAVERTTVVVRRALPCAVRPAC